jgi:uncharacterized protein YkuJ
MMKLKDLMNEATGVALMKAFENQGTWVATFKFFSEGMGERYFEKEFALGDFKGQNSFSIVGSWSPYSGTKKLSDSTNIASSFNGQDANINAEFWYDDRQRTKRWNQRIKIKSAKASGGKVIIKFS